MSGSFLEFVDKIDWSGYEVSIFEVLLVVFALIKRYSLVSLLILGVVLVRGFIVVQANTNFGGEFAETVPFIVYTFCSVVFLVYAVVKLFSRD